MTSAVSFDRYWGTRLSRIENDCHAMTVVFELYWTADAKPCGARLRFNGVSKFDFTAERLFNSDVVELISLEGEVVNSGLRVMGELSNYEFTIICQSVDEKDI